MVADFPYPEVIQRTVGDVPIATVRCDSSKLSFIPYLAEVSASWNAGIAPSWSGTTRAGQLKE